jgi:hypothetical protein
MVKYSLKSKGLKVSTREKKEKRKRESEKVKHKN